MSRSTQNSAKKMAIQKTEFKQRIGNPSHWFGEYYLSGSNGGRFILYNPNETLSRAIELKAKTYQEALKEAKRI